MRFWTALLILLPGAALAEAPAALRPTRDVDVTYKVPMQGAPDLVQRLRWSAATQRQRVDLPNSANWMVLDFAAHRMEMVHEDTHQITDMPAPPSADQPVGEGAYVRTGSATVSGLACTQWRTADASGNQTLACYTPDGVLLRAEAGGQVLMEAVSVKYTAQDASVFQPPGYPHQQGGQP
jgi:hypothetical protein